MDQTSIVNLPVVVEGLVLTERQLHGEIETAHPGYLGAQDTFYVGTLKGASISNT